MDKQNDRQLGKNTKQGQWKPTLKEIILWSFLGILFVGQVVFCFISYNGAGWDFVLYIGWAVFACGIILGWLSRIAFLEYLARRFLTRSFLFRNCSSASDISIPTVR